MAEAVCDIGEGLGQGGIAWDGSNELTDGQEGVEGSYREMGNNWKQRRFKL